MRVEAEAPRQESSSLNPTPANKGFTWSQTTANWVSASALPHLPPTPIPWRPQVPVSPGRETPRSAPGPLHQALGRGGQPVNAGLGCWPCSWRGLAICTEGNCGRVCGDPGHTPLCLSAGC
ncbi:hypothetical protein H1C71_041696 [Ictidomys tridecemlineatus]|nr:hypothetical protein H1C71_041696 [Ictidomys tridecemlineatus]KAG3283993.1 hypothetical protein H1C71_041696 [Ictidomys tridecemlineatus]